MAAFALSVIVNEYPIGQVSFSSLVILLMNQKVRS